MEEKYMSDKNESHIVPAKKINDKNSEQSAWASLNNKQRLFVLYYLQSFNATAAYREAYPSVKNDDTAAACASKLLRIAKVSESIQERLDGFWESKEKECGRALNEILTLAYSDISNVIEISNGRMTVKDLDKIDSRIIKSIKQTTSATGDSIQVTLHDKIQALALLSKILNMLPDKIDVEKNITVNVIPAKRPPRSEYPPRREVV